MNDISSAHLTGKLLLAMPGTADPHFQRTVVYVCAHSAQGAMGVIVNKRIPDLPLATMLDQIGVEGANRLDLRPVYAGGPVEPERGFVLHSPDYDIGESTLKINKGFSMTTTMEVLEDIARGGGPKRMLVTLGYSGWGPGQLDREILDNGWLTLTPGPGLVFSEDDDAKWTNALHLLGIEPKLLSATAGHA